MKLNPTGPYDRSFEKHVESVLSGLSSDLHRVRELMDDDAHRLVSYFLELACQAQNARNIKLGREAALELPRQWLLDRIERIADQTLDLDNDDWEYRRLLELADLLDVSFLSRLVRRGFLSPNPEIVEAANDFRPKTLPVA